MAHTSYGSKYTLTGRIGKAAVGTKLVARCKKWDVNPKLAGGAEWGDSDSQGYTCRAPGRRDATFNMEGVYDTLTEVFDIFQPEDIATVTLWLDPITNMVYYDFPRALCNDFSLSVDIDTEEIIGWQSSWGADGKFYYPGQTDAPTRTLPTISPAHAVDATPLDPS